MNSGTLGDCPVCGTNNWHVVFIGKIRDGSFGTSTIDDAKVVACSCSLQRLETFALTTSTYEGDEYRLKYNGTVDDTELLELHLEEQSSRLVLLGTKNLKGATVIDVGCGHGAFLDAVSGLAASTIGIEPFERLHNSLIARGHEVYRPSDQRITHFQNSADFVTSFNVIEHLEDPYEHLVSAWRMVKPGGQIIVQTCNLNEILMLTGASGFKEFWYRTAHNWYFTPDNLEGIAARAGLSAVKVSTFHEYNFSNFINWHRISRPTGNNDSFWLSVEFETIWKASIERSGRGSSIILRATKPT